jgi:simple sugar transport system substrate-binding protein
MEECDMKRSSIKILTRILAMVIIITLASSMVACDITGNNGNDGVSGNNNNVNNNDKGKGNDNGAQTTTTATHEDETIEPANSGFIRIGFSQCDLAESDWRKANTSSMQDALSPANGFDLIIADAQNSHDKQLSDVTGFIKQKVDYIVIATVNETGWKDVLQQAYNAEIPVILVDRTALVSEDLYVTWVGANFRDEGNKAVQWLAEFKGTEPLVIAHLQGVMGSSAQTGRSAALNEAATANGWVIAGQKTADWDTTKAMEIMQNWLKQNPDINVVYAENDNMAGGVIQAIQAAGKEAGGENGVTVISFDANRRYLQMALESGVINYNVECNPLHGPRVAEIIKALERGDTLPKVTYVDEVAFDWRQLTQEVIDARQY